MSGAGERYPAFFAYVAERAAARILETADLVDAERELRGMVRAREGGPTVVAALAAARAELRDRGVEPPAVA